MKVWCNVGHMKCRDMKIRGTGLLKVVIEIEVFYCYTVFINAF